MKYPTPEREGHWWAKLCLHDEPDLNSVDWEVVQVWDNNGNERNGAPPFLVHVPGVQESQPLDHFIWGPPVHKPHELK